MDLLIVDDEASLRDFLSIVFEEERWRVETAASLAAARAALAKNEPDLILCDLMLPDGSGIDLLREVKASTPSVAVIMITAHTSTKSAVDALKTGAFDYIAKPFDIDELKIIVRNAVERKESRTRTFTCARRWKSASPFPTSSAAARECRRFSRSWGALPRRRRPC